MNHRQIEKSNMYKKMLIFFANPLHIVIWTTFTRLADEIAKFVSLNTSLAKYIQQHHSDIKGFTKSKVNAFTAMIELVVRNAQKAYVWAVDTSNDTLAEIFDVQKTDLMRAGENRAYTMVKNIRDALSANIASMESVQLAASDLTAINAAIKVYENTMGTPGAAQSHKTEGTQAMEDLFDPIDTSLGLIENLIVSSYSESHPDIVKEFLLSQHIDKLPTHHSGLSATITDAVTGGELKGAELSVNGKTAISDLYGCAEIIKTKPGTYMAKVMLSNYITQEIRVIIKRGKVTEIEVKLVK